MAGLCEALRARAHRPRPVARLPCFLVSALTVGAGRQRACAHRRCGTRACACAAPQRCKRLYAASPFELTLCVFCTLPIAAPASGRSKTLRGELCEWPTALGAAQVMLAAVLLLCHTAASQLAAPSQLQLHKHHSPLRLPLAIDLAPAFDRRPLTCTLHTHPSPAPFGNRPLRLSLAIALAPAFDRGISLIGEKLNVRKGIAFGVSVCMLLLGVCSVV